jgi:hypothetical protein
MTDLDTTPRARRSPLLLWGFAPLAVAVLLAVLVVLFAPSVAPEIVVVQPGDPITTTTSTSTTVAEVAP